METSEKLKKVHELELKIALEIKRICEKNHINYFMTAGTLLGAVRHGGFIPWDDDMDIGMLRCDYERFIEACEKDMGEEFYLQTWDTDPEYPFSFGKVRLNRTHFVESFSKNSGIHDGIFVDIFPFDNVPDNEAERRLQSKRYFICKRLLWIKKGMGQYIKSENKTKCIKYNAFWLLSRVVRYKSVKEYYKKIQQRYNRSETQRIVTDGSYAYEKESIPRRWAENLEPVAFEGEELLSYQDRIAYLEHFYGNYMELPPVEKRNRHMLLDVDFGPYA